MQWPFASSAQRFPLFSLKTIPVIICVHLLASVSWCQISCIKSASFERFPQASCHTRVHRMHWSVCVTRLDVEPCNCSSTGYLLSMISRLDSVKPVAIGKTSKSSNRSCSPSCIPYSSLAPAVMTPQQSPRDTVMQQVSGSRPSQKEKV